MSYARRFSGFAGAANALPLTQQAAIDLDQHLVTNGCNGCDDMRSGLRQLTFKFKAAVLSDPNLQNTAVGNSLNMSTVLAMTGFGPGTSSALSAVLGAARQSEAIPCTDDQGNCLGVSRTPQIPASLQPMASSIAAQIQSLLRMGSQLVGPTGNGQDGLVGQVTAMIQDALEQIGVWNITAGGPAAPAQPQPVVRQPVVTQPPPVVVTQPAAQPAPVVVTQPAAAATTSTSPVVYAVGGLALAALVAGGYYWYTRHRRSA